MEFSEKMQLLPLNLDLNNQISDIVSKVLDLYEKGLINKDLNIKVEGKFKNDTNIVKHLLGGSQISNLINNNKDKKAIYTKVSPVKIKMDQQSQIKWIK